jgi:hypothetical protein
MIIYPLPAQELDDKILSKQIKSIAWVLRSVHHTIAVDKLLNNPDINCSSSPAPVLTNLMVYNQWASTCRANYLKLVEMGDECCRDWFMRFVDFSDIDCVMKNKYGHKLQSVIEWCKLHIPELPAEKCKTCEGNKAVKITTHSDGHYYPQACLTCVEAVGLVGITNTGLCKNTTPFPACVPGKYIEYLSSTVRQGQPKPVDIEQSYRNYYKAKLQKKLDVCNKTHPILNAELNDITQNCFYPTFTRRKKPEWLEI